MGYTDLRLVAMVLVMLNSGANFPSAAQKSRSSATPKPFKRIELEGQYSFEVPNSFSPRRISDKVAAVPIYHFDGRTTIQVEISPYSGLIPINPETGKLVPPATGDLLCELGDDTPDPTKLAVDAGPPLTRYFKIGEDTDVYYGCRVMDNAYECTSNSPCPLTVRGATRYTVEYAFAVFDKPRNSIIQFTGSHDGPEKRIRRFEGDGKLLRDTIVPSLRSIK